MHPLATRVLGGSFIVLVLTGVALLWTYNPTSTELVQDLHTLAAAVFVMAALATLASAAITRVRRRQTCASWLYALGVPILALLSAALGAGIAWQTVAGAGFVVESEAHVEPWAGPPASVPTAPVTRQQDGIWTALRSDVEVIISSNGTLLSPGEYRTFAVAHAVVMPLALLAIYYRDRRRSEMEP